MEGRTRKYVDRLQWSVLKAEGGQRIFQGLYFERLDQMQLATRQAITVLY